MLNVFHWETWKILGILNVCPLWNDCCCGGFEAYQYSWTIFSNWITFSLSSVIINLKKVYPDTDYGCWIFLGILVSFQSSKHKFSPLIFGGTLGASVYSYCNCLYSYLFIQDYLLFAIHIISLWIFCICCHLFGLQWKFLSFQSPFNCHSERVTVCWAMQLSI